MYSIDVVPELYQLMEAKVGRSANSLGTIVADGSLTISCCEFWMKFEWPDGEVVVTDNCDSEELKNTFSASILENSFIKFDRSDPSKLITIIHDSMSVEIASAILSDLVGDTFAYFKRFTYVV
jgi:hypothetical protein